MINWKAKTEYYNINNGQQITKQMAKKHFKILRKYKINSYENCTRNERGEWFGTGTITWINECEPNRQLNIFGRQKIRG